MDLKEIKKQISILNIVSNYIKTMKKGNSHIALCPFHNDKNPSLSISEKQNMFKCFSCGEAGGGIEFIKKIENISYGEAVLKACELNDIDIKPDWLHKKINSNSLIQCNNFVAEKYSFCLASLKDKKPIKYLLQTRKIKPETIEKFKIGFAPGFEMNFKYGTFLKSLAKITLDENQKINIQDLYELGLLKTNDQGKDYDFFNNRLMFPIFDEYDNVVGFSGRVWQENDLRSKYQNSQASKVFKKQDILFNLNNLKKDQTKYNEIFIVEGFMDVIALSEIGVNNVVATMGTSLSKTQINKLIKYFEINKEIDNPKIILMVDNDLSGQKFCKEIAKNLFENTNFDVYCCKWDKEFKDIDNLIKNQNVNDFNELLSTNKLKIQNYFKWITQLNPDKDYQDAVKTTKINFDYIFKNLNQYQPEFKNNISTEYGIDAVKCLMDFIKSKTNDNHLIDAYSDLEKVLKYSVIGVDLNTQKLLNQIKKQEEEIKYLKSLNQKFNNQTNFKIEDFLKQENKPTKGVIFRKF